MVAKSYDMGLMINPVLRPGGCVAIGIGRGEDVTFDEKRWKRQKPFAKKGLEGDLITAGEQEGTEHGQVLTRSSYYCTTR